MGREREWGIYGTTVSIGEKGFKGKREIGGWDYGVRAFNLVRRLMCDGKVIGQKGNEMG